MPTMFSQRPFPHLLVIFFTEWHNDHITKLGRPVVLDLQQMDWQYCRLVQN